jgi:hypothetical protein
MAASYFTPVRRIFRPFSSLTPPTLIDEAACFWLLLLRRNESGWFKAPWRREGVMPA